MIQKILFFIDGLVAGGKERRFVELIHYIKRNTDIELKIVLTEDDIYYSQIFSLNIPIIILKRQWFKKDPFLFFRFYKIVKDFKPDIIHTWGIMANFYSIPTKLFLKRPIVSNLIAEGRKIFNTWSLSNFYFQINCFFSDIIISNSKAGFEAYNIIENDKNIIIRNGVRPERFMLNINKQKFLNEFQINAKFIVIMVASMSKYKNYDLFLDVAKIVSKARYDVIFIGVGDGPDFEKVHNRILNENIRNVVLTGSRDNIEELVAISDIGILLTYSEGISNSIIEYMASGKPVITTDINGGSREIIVNLETGFIMESNAESIAGRINRLLDNDNLRNSMGKKGKKIIEEKFSIDRMGKEYLNVYEIFSHRPYHAKK
jgi:glycosyltransferase involved in cell wall biosynthesis